ncbi:hypothetical protein Ciccas_004612 [Cichlidogyrus casuarinus]|uniref:Uncharacterized protein n=1 Tax=Cichlidogyrus casuarinus TaxID=1844966 RepID=A0ABD2QAZ9_9PLAT
MMPWQPEDSNCFDKVKQRKIDANKQQLQKQRIAVSVNPTDINRLLAYCAVWECDLRGLLQYAHR